MHINAANDMTQREEMASKGERANPRYYDNTTARRCSRSTHIPLRHVNIPNIPNIPGAGELVIRDKVSRPLVHAGMMLCAKRHSTQSDRGLSTHGSKSLLGICWRIHVPCFDILKSAHVPDLNITSGSIVS